VEIADPMELAAAIFVLERVGARVHVAVDEFVLGGLVRGVGQVHVPEEPCARRAVEEFVEGEPRAFRGHGPIGPAMLPDVLRDRDGGKAEDRGFAGGGSGPRDVRVDAEIRAMVDPGDHPDFAGGQAFGFEGVSCEGAAAAEGDPGAVRRGAAESVPAGLEFHEGHRRGRRDGVTDATLRTAWRDDETISPGGKDGVEGCESLRFHSIIIRENQWHREIPDGRETPSDRALASCLRERRERVADALRFATKKPPDMMGKPFS